MSLTEFDIGPLTWVKGEIDTALHKAKEQLAHFAANIEDTTPLRFAQPHLHQVKGAIQMVGLDGLARFAEEVERFMAALEAREVEPTADTLDLLDQGFNTISKYLDELMGGAPDVPLKLSAAFNQLLAARKVERVSESDLFFPDLAVRAPKSDAPPPVAEAERPRYVRNLRTQYQKGLLGYLRNPNDRAGLAAMRDALAAIESSQTQPAARTFVWSAAAFVEGLLEGGLPANFNVKSLCGRIDQQIRRLAENSTKVAEKLNRDVLYYVASAKSATPRLASVKQAFELESYLPPELVSSAPADLALEKAKPILRELADLVSAAKEAWLKFSAGNKDILKIFQDHTRRALSKSQALGFEPLTGLVEKIASGADELAASGEVSEMVSMEMATALMLTENAVETYARLTPEFARQAEVQGRRLQASLLGQSTDDIEQVPLLDEISRKAQEKLLLNQVGTEIQTNLRHIEQVLDAFFRDHTKRADIPGLTSYIRQVFGALQILELERAADLLNACQRIIDKFTDANYQPEQRDLELVAEGLSSLGFYIEAVQHGRNDAFNIIAPVIKTFPGIKNSEVRDSDEIEVAEVMEAAPAPLERPTVSVESGIEEQKRHAQALFDVWSNAPTAEHRSELRNQLSTLAQDADLIDDGTLKERAAKALSALEQAGEAPSAAVGTAVAALTAPKVAAVAPSAETARLIEASKEVVDRELLETYLEEAAEVLATVREHLGIMRRRPHDHEALITIRRGFHTLKGSGRMVGLKDLGEVAWGIEQTMNRWLEEEKDATPELLDMIQQAHDAFAGWVEILNRDGTVEVNATDLLATAASLREDPSGPFDLSARREALIASRQAAIEPALDTTIEISAPALEVPAETEITLEAPTEEAFFLELVEPEAAVEPMPETDVALEPESESIELEAIETTSAAIDELPAPPEISDEPEDIQIGSSSISAGLYQLFLDEAATHVASLDAGLAQIQTNPAHPVAYDYMRAAHTLAGISSTVGFTLTADLAHALEQWLMDVLHNPRTLNAHALQVMQDAVVSLKGMLTAIQSREAPQAADFLVDYLKQMVTDARKAREQDEQAELEALMAPPEAEPTIEEPVAAAPAAPPASEVISFPAHAQAAPPQPNLRVVPMREKPDAIEIDSNIKDDVDEQLLPVFLEEAQELMPFIGTQLRAWRDKPTQTDASQALQRALHTLKGSARMAGAMRLGEFTHHMETRVETMVDGGAPANELFDDLDNYFDAVGDLHEALIKGESVEAIAPVAPVVLGMQAQATLPQADILAEMEQAAARAVLRVRADTVDRLVNEAGEVSITRSRIEGEMLHFKQSLKDLTENVIRLRNQLREVEIQAESQMQSRISAAQETQFDPLEFDRFTRLQEITRMMAESVNDVATVQQTLLKNLDEAEAALIAQGRLNRELQQGLMRIRMVPLSNITERLHRIVRQTAKDVGKKAALKIEGESVELDRSVLEKMTAPFEHLLRNAVAHGIETDHDREIAGKAEIGGIVLRARQEGNEVALIIRDDGGGIDLDRVRAKAVEQGLIGANDDIPAAKLTELIFQAGFSTASEVTQVSGRGVGMDVVRNEIASLGGRIEVDSDKGQGTTFTIYLPLTLAVTQVVTVSAGENQFALPSSMVEQVQEVKPAKLAEIYQAGQVDWLGNTYPLYYLPRLLGNLEAAPEAKSYSSVILLRSGTHRVAVHVDALQGNQEVVVKNIGPQLARVSGISGATVLGNGEIMLIINPVQLAHRETPHAAAGQPTIAVKREELVTAPIIMVVDDSLTVRKITGRLLSKEGYQVVTAKDGVDALQQLQEYRPAVMLVDIEMPRMDGFELTKNVRGDADTAGIPIIMITSRTAEKHRNYARELGVNVYLGKPYQEDELLSHIAHFVQQGVTA
ncbi:MAG: Hpt domain-containing protein [Burkholderiales bacterium]|nr:Hpt domain-containing protein [Burkholderiales bacterium]